jgi:rare lipoprotein A
LTPKKRSKPAVIRKNIGYSYPAHIHLQKTLKNKETGIMNIGIKSSGLLAGTAMALLLLTGCAETQLASTWAKQVSWPGQAGRGTYKVGNPYKVGSVWYYPEENFNLVETGIASWYGPGFHEDHTANGETFDQNELTAAHRTLQLPCLARVTNLENGRSVVVRINDRGPYLHGRIMDVSMRAAQLLGFADKGTARVRLEVLEKESRQLAALAKSGQDTSHMSLADLQQKAGGAPATASAAAVAPARVAANQPAPQAAPVKTSADEEMPESLRTPTITVEELNKPGAKGPQAYAPVPPSSSVSSSPEPVPGHLNKGKFMPDPVVEKQTVHPTGLFVQAGSFSVLANAQGLTKKLANIAPTTIEQITVNGRQLYRVKVGPIASVAEADKVLEKVIRISAGAKVVKN